MKTALERRLVGEVLAPLDRERNLVDHGLAGQIGALPVDLQAEPARAEIDRAPQPRDRGVAQLRRSRDADVGGVHLAVERRADPQFGARATGRAGRQDAEVAGKAEGRVVDQGDRLLDRPRDMGDDVELGGVASLDADPGDRDVAVFDHQVVDVTPRDGEVHPPGGEGRGAADAGERRHGLEVAQGQIVELEPARDRLLRDRALVEIARPEGDGRLRPGHHAIGDVGDHPRARLTTELRRPVQLEILRGDIGRTHLGAQRQISIAPGDLGARFDLSALGGKTRRSHGDCLEVGGDPADRHGGVDRQRTRQNVGTIDHAVRGLQLEREGRQDALEISHAGKTAIERDLHACERQQRLDSKELDRAQPVEREREADPVGRCVEAARGPDPCRLAGLLQLERQLRYEPPRPAPEAQGRGARHDRVIGDPVFQDQLPA